MKCYKKIRENLTKEEKSDLMQESKSVPSCVYEAIREICKDTNE